MLERGESIGHTWVHLYDGLVLHTGKHLSALPGMAFPSSTPLFPSRNDFVDYLRRYAQRFDVPVQTRAEVASVARDDGHWIVHLRDGVSIRSRVIVAATGIVSNPYVPEIPGQDTFKGRIIHSVHYRRPQPFANERVLVVGAGNSSGEICAELSEAGARVTVAIRSGARVVPRQLFGIPIQYFGVALNSLPKPVLRRAMSITTALSERLRGASPLPPPGDNPCAAVPLIGFHLMDGVRSGRIQLRRGLAEFTPDGVRFGDGAAERVRDRDPGDRISSCGWHVRILDHPRRMRFRRQAASRQKRGRSRLVFRRTQLRCRGRPSQYRSRLAPGCPAHCGPIAWYRPNVYTNAATTE